MPPIILTNPVEVGNRLEQLGWTLDDLLDVADAMVAARSSCTENDPAGAPGWMSWKAGSRRLREVGRPKGLVKDETDGVPSVIDSVRGLKFAVSNTNELTGVEYASPSNYRKKGPALNRAVDQNQGSLFDPREPAKGNVVPLSRLKRQPGLLVSWYLCNYNEADEHRAELSCPVKVEEGFFSDFIERIILIGPDGPNGPVKRKAPVSDGPEYDIPVKKK